MTLLNNNEPRQSSDDRYIGVGITTAEGFRRRRFSAEIHTRGTRLATSTTTTTFASTHAGFVCIIIYRNPIIVFLLLLLLLL